MKTFKLKPINNSTRHANLLQKNVLIKNNKIFKDLRISLKKAHGRSTSTGHITSWHKQRGSKLLYRDIINDKKMSKSVLIGVNYDPNRNSFTSVNFDLDKKEFFNDLYIKNTYPGSLVNKSTNASDLRNGYRLKLKDIPTGTLVSNISQKNSSNGKYAKAAGSSALLVEKNNFMAQLKLPSDDTIELSVDSLATIGIVANEVHKNIVIGKAGRSRNMGRRPIVRGIAMNPVDHPHGGRSNGGRPSVTPWGLPTKNKFKLKRRKYKNKKVCQDQNGKGSF